MSSSEDTYIRALEVVVTALDVMQEMKRRACHDADDTGSPDKMWQANGEYVGVLDAKLLVRDMIESIRKAGAA